ncbi:MAG: hypothetical protein QOD53_2201 [Thermoleophilaceae bacterium]|jgi:hypothetical protein|nr:hypothetical protein [Thermoleophilaceae bacterium]
MNEIAPGVFHWTAFHPNIKFDVSSYLVADSGTAIDPLLPPEGLASFEGREPRQAILSNRHHLRDAQKLVDEFGDIPIRCHSAGLHEFADGPDVQAFEWGDELAPGITALKVEAICDEETAFRIDIGDGLLVVADAVMRYGDDLHFVPEEHLGDDKETVKAAIREAYAQLLDEPFDSILPAHGSPLMGGGKEALRRFVESS